MLQDLVSSIIRRLYYLKRGTANQFEEVTGDNGAIDVNLERFSYAYISSIATTPVKGSAGFLHSITVGETAAGAITIYDHPTGVGTVVAVLKASVAEQTFIFDVAFTNGLTIVTAAASKLSVSYR